MLLSRPPSRFHFFSFSLSFSPTFNSLSECLPFSLSPSPFSPCPTHPSLFSLSPSLSFSPSRFSLPLCTSALIVTHTHLLQYNTSTKHHTHTLSTQTHTHK